MQRFVGIYRSDEDLKRGLSEIDKLKDRHARVRVEGSRLFNPGWHLARDLKSMLTVSEAVARSALARQESRGAHSRIDFPGLDPAWGKRNNIIARDGQAMKLFERPIPEMPADLAALVAQK
jgi:succinate dehydrogenase / fumarate reductase flavoprotein subunit